jgi:hypothetical protein
LDWKQIATSAGDLKGFKESISHLFCKRRAHLSVGIMDRSDLHWCQFPPKLKNYFEKKIHFWQVSSKDVGGSTRSLWLYPSVFVLYMAIGMF